MLPNLLSIARMVFAGVVIWAVVAGRPRLALIIFAVAAFTDFLDGWLARRMKLISPIGQLLDPIADKALLSGLFAALGWVRAAPVWYVAIVFGRDIFLLAGSGVVLARTSYQQLRPTLWGKLSTLLQIASAVLLLILIQFQDEGLHRMASVLVAVSAGVTVASGAQYLWRGWRSVSRR